ncbi:MAG TPA: non-heme iron oxygenase ferredoxin subunit [Roseiflexaceae bacterium]|nr:non-heme iron oxygenase ferredoxin subunit [Roseiflexaceae bacterium]
MPEFVRIAAVGDVPPDSMRAFEHNGRRIAVYHIGGSWYATDDICSHEYAHLSEGWLEPEDCTVECPLHGSRFDIRTGQALTLPAFTPIAVYEVRVEGEDVLVRL